MTLVLAPGKVILFGEYAVLDGSSALVVAVERYVRCHARDYAGTRVRSLGVDGHRHPAEIQSPFLSAVRSAVGEGSGDFLVDSSAFQWSDSQGRAGKLGLGSSAAATVAFAVALRDRLGVPNPASPKAVFQIAQNVHRKIQGSGSGADVAASCFGGALSYRWLNDNTAARGGPDDVSLKCLGGTGAFQSLVNGPAHLLVAWTGKSASTRDLVRSVHSHRMSSDYAEIMALVSETSQRGRDAWVSRDYPSLHDAARHGVDALERLGHLAGVDLVTENHRRLQALFNRRDVIVKPTGAGGGDLAWLVPTDPEIDDAVLQKLRDAKVPAWQMEIASQGVRLLTGDQ